MKRVTIKFVKILVSVLLFLLISFLILVVLMVNSIIEGNYDYRYKGVSFLIEEHKIFYNTSSKILYGYAKVKNTGELPLRNCFFALYSSNKTGFYYMWYEGTYIGSVDEDVPTGGTQILKIRMPDQSHNITQGYYAYWPLNASKLGSIKTFTFNCDPKYPLGSIPMRFIIGSDRHDDRTYAQKINLEYVE